MNIFMTLFCTILRYFKYNNNYFTDSLLVNEIFVMFFFACLKCFFPFWEVLHLGPFTEDLAGFWPAVLLSCRDYSASCCLNEPDTRKC